MWSLPARTRWADGTVWLALVTAGVSCAVALASAWRWPLVGDAALMRYVVFLLHGGMAPYREIVDVNLPGSYALEVVAMRGFGAGAVGLRLYDGALCGLACLCTVVLSEGCWRARVCGGMAALLFVVIHLRDGVVEAGQRDLAMAVIALVALVLLLRVRGLVGLLGFELLVGLTLVVKPTLILMALLPVYAAWVRRKLRRKPKAAHPHRRNRKPLRPPLDAARAAYRSGFLAAIDRAQPQVIVLSSQYCLGAGDDLKRVARWPAMN